MLILEYIHLLGEKEENLATGGTNQISISFNTSTFDDLGQKRSLGHRNAPPSLAQENDVETHWSDSSEHLPFPDNILVCKPAPHLPPH